jgi:transcriptional regulator with XRE-family HTH domain
MGTKKSSNQVIRAPTALDFEIGKRIRKARHASGLTQEELAEGLGTTFQQVQKYESGKNRVAASRLVDMARFMNISAAWLLIGEGFMSPLDEHRARTISIDGECPPQKEPMETS